MRTPDAKFPVWVRPHTSDIYVFDQIFARREYRCLDHISGADFIVDCGANVGYSAVYFLTRFPTASIVAVEPDTANFQALRRNTEPYGARCEIRNCAVWSSATELVMSEVQSGAGDEWGRMVREARPGETATLTAVDLESLIGNRRCSILKMDIEGTEEIIFADRPTWLSRVDSLVIEIHSQRGERIVRDVLAGAGFKLTVCDELIVGVR
jgi:FkbM family methyltransferase